MIIYSRAGLANQASRPREWNDFRQVSGSGVAIETWYVAGNGNAVALGAGGVPGNTLLYAIPFLAPSRGGRLDGVGINCTTLSVGSTVKLGIYDSVSHQLYPKTLLYSGSTPLDTGSTGVKTYTDLAVELEPGEMYFAAYAQSANTTQAVRNLVAANWDPLLGHTGVVATTTFVVGYSVSNTYSNPLPVTYPGSPTVLISSSTIIPAIYLRYSQ